jgi:Holliday junction resolvase RusA-like endonuclease
MTDDAQIYDVYATKLWTRDPSIHVVIQEMT